MHRAALRLSKPLSDRGKRMKVNLKQIGEQVIVITGASSSIGLATALLAARRGARVVLNSRDEQDLRTAVQRVQGEGGRAIHVVWRCRRYGSDAASGPARGRGVRANRHLGEQCRGLGLRAHRRGDAEDARRIFETNAGGGGGGHPPLRLPSAAQRSRGRSREALLCLREVRTQAVRPDEGSDRIRRPIQRRPGPRQGYPARAEGPATPGCAAGTPATSCSRACTPRPASTVARPCWAWPSSMPG